ncbi:MAG: UDP-N-acetylglucosamine 1-carboxyvinyltransferase, partial [Bacillota bacterium]
MDSYLIQGGYALQGELTVHGAKNSVLPILAAALLNRSQEQIRLEKVPDLFDVRAMLSILTNLGVSVSTDGADVILRTDPADCYHIPEQMMREMRSSIFLMGPLLGRFGKASVCYPGGCAIGERPIDLHLSGLQALGAIIEEKNGYIHARGNLRGAEINLSYPSVGATENLIMAGVLARGETIIHNAAREPEIIDLQNFLNILGARVDGAGSRTVTVKGVTAVSGGCYRVYPDRIAAGTYLIAAAVTGGRITLIDVRPEHLQSLIAILQKAGLPLEISGERVTLHSGGSFKAVKLVETEP